MPTSHDLKWVQGYLRSSMISCPLYCGVQHSVHYCDFGVIKDKACTPQKKKKL